MMKQSRDQVHYAMSHVRSKGSKIEQTLGRALWAAGLRYRKHYTKLIGKPDFLLVKDRIAIFSDSDFWHGLNWDQQKSHFGDNLSYWEKKIQGNIRRDHFVSEELRKQGWTVLRFTESEIKKDVAACVKEVQKSQSKNRAKLAMASAQKAGSNSVAK